MQVRILAIESSCDETSAAVLINDQLKSNVILSQSIHAIYGGVVPELASRAHQQHIIPVVNKSLSDAGLSKKELDVVAFTHGPGLLGSLLVGVSFAKALAFSRNIPFIEVNHLQAHVLSHFIEEPKPKFPYLCLTISGGHTQIVKVDDYLDMHLLGQTLDDAAGEAFDKTAKLLGLPYPGGHLIDQKAIEGDPFRFIFTDTRVPGLDFSFSGIKTSVLYFIRDQLKSNPEFVQHNLADLCASIQHKIVEMLLEKLILASHQTGIKEIAVSGGVSVNSYLRAKLQEQAILSGWRVYVPRPEYCTDNAAMIGMTAYFKFLKKEFADLSSVPFARMKY